MSRRSNPVSSQASRLVRATEGIVVSSPLTRSGQPVFANTRVPVKALFDYLAAGDPLSRFLEHFPDVDEEQAVLLIEQIGKRTKSKVSAKKKVVMKTRKKTNPAAVEVELEREMYGGIEYEYYPLGKYVVAAPGVCGGRPTIKYHRLDARYVIANLKRGDTPELIAKNYKIPVAAVHEALELVLST